MKHLYASLATILARPVPQFECASIEQHRAIDHYAAEVLRDLAHDALEALGEASTTGEESQRRLLKGMSQGQDRMEQLVQGVLKAAIRGVEHYLKAPLPPRGGYRFTPDLHSEEQVGTQPGNH
jgi:hypothetical protein